MRYLCIIFLLSSCDFYLDTYKLKIDNLDSGKVVVSSCSLYKEFFIDEPHIQVEVNKFEEVYISYYPYFGKSLSRYPYGCYLKPGKKRVAFDKKMGVLTQSANEIHLNKGIIKFEEVSLLLKKIKSKIDPWVYDKEDVKMILLGDITLASLTSKSRYKIDDLNFLFNWESENPCFSYWYPMVITFENADGYYYYLIIEDDGSYVGFYRR